MRDEIADGTEILYLYWQQKSLYPRLKYWRKIRERFSTLRDTAPINLRGEDIVLSSMGEYSGYSYSSAGLLPNLPAVFLPIDSISRDTGTGAKSDLFSA